MSALTVLTDEFQNFNDGRSRTPDTSEDRAVVEQLSTAIVEALNSGDFHHSALQRLVPQFTSDNEMIEGMWTHPKSKEEYLSKHRRWLKAVPNRTLRVLQAVSDLDEKKGIAAVWVFIKVHGWGAGHMVSESISCFKWRRSQGVWWCHSHTGMRGVAEIQCSY